MVQRKAHYSESRPQKSSLFVNAPTCSTCSTAAGYVRAAVGRGVGGGPVQGRGGRGTRGVAGVGEEAAAGLGPPARLVAQGRHIPDILHMDMNKLKGTVSRDFLTRFFSLNIFS
jgi:hypothetical protein